MPMPAWIPIALWLMLGGALAQSDNRIDLQWPDAPELAAFGDHAVGVRTLEVVDRDRIDIVRTRRGAEAPRYDRPLALEVWYPAALPEGMSEGGVYEVVTRDGALARLKGRAVRDAEPAVGRGPYPLVVLSHGYPGNRFQLAHFGENLASKGYVVVSIDHTDSTYSDRAAFASTLYNRPLDQLFVVDEMDRRSAASEGFSSGLIDASRTGIIGYSMGAYGLVNVLGAGFTEASTQLFFAPPGWWGSRRPCCSWPAATTTSRGTSTAHAPSSRAPSTPSATCSPSRTLATTPLDRSRNRATRAGTAASHATA